MIRYIYTLVAFLFIFTFNSFAQDPGLVISSIFANPGGADDNQEFVELTATKAINFVTTPYTVVFNDGGNGGVNGWASGGSGSYAIEINTGTIAVGEKIYVGGNAIVITGAACKQVLHNTTSSGGDGGFGNGNSAGVLGNGGGNADGVAVFNVAATGVTNTKVPIDAIFFGTAVGSATGKFLVPTNDHYDATQGKFGVGTNTYVAPDAVSGQYAYGTGEFNPSTFAWTTIRTFANTATAPNCNSASTVSVVVPNSLSITVSP